MKKQFFITFFISIVVFGLLFYFVGPNVVRSETLVSDNILNEVNEITEVDVDEKPQLPTPQRVNDKNEILFVMMGVDSPTVEESKGTRTDTIMLCKVNFNSGKIDIISIPRDTRVPIRGKEDKINHAHAFGGSELTVKTIRDFLNIDLKYFVKVDYRAVKSMVDAIGGVELDVPIDMKYHDTTKGMELHIDIDKGLQTLDGQQAHDYLRFRSGYPEGDLGRVKAQQYFLEEFAKQLLQPKNILKLPQIVKTYYDYVETNIPMGMVLRGLTVANDLDTENINMYIIPGEGKYINKISYMIYDREKTEELINDVLYNYKLTNY